VQVARHLGRRRDDERHVRVALLAERGRHADVDRVAALEHREVGGRDEPLFGHQRAHIRGGDVLDVRAALVQLLHPLLVDVDAEHLEAGLRQLHGERQTHIAEADDGELGGAILEAFLQDLGGAAGAGDLAGGGHEAGTVTKRSDERQSDAC